jgi:hypothetical protein
VGRRADRRQDRWRNLCGSSAVPRVVRLVDRRWIVRRTSEAPLADHRVGPVVSSAGTGEPRVSFRRRCRGTSGGILSDAGVDGGGVLPQCLDGRDNDGDGKADAMDPDCTGYLDNDESSFATGIKGDNMDPCWQDVSSMAIVVLATTGAGGTSRDPKQPSDRCPYDDTIKNCGDPGTLECRINVYPVPSCDCFGCCEFPLGNGKVNVVLTSTCSSANLSDPVACPRCTPVLDCNNPCERCELCMGKTTLPPDCYNRDAGTDGSAGGSTGGSAGGSVDGGAGGSTGGSAGGGSTGGSSGGGLPECPSTLKACDATTCGTGYWCLTGCWSLSSRS